MITRVESHSVTESRLGIRPITDLGRNDNAFAGGKNLGELIRAGRTRRLIDAAERRVLLAAPRGRDER